MSCSKKTIGYMPGLDGLRALAVFAVIGYHLNLPWASGGLLGVGLFFVLSGYLITDILLTQWACDGLIDLKDFWLRRVRRLLPALFLMLSGVSVWVLIFETEHLISIKNEILAAVFYFNNWYLIFHQVSYFEQFGPPTPLGHLWSLAVEEQFYLLWPIFLGLMLRFLRKRKRVIAGTSLLILASALAMALLYVPGEDPSRVYYGTDTRAFALLMGALLAMVWPSRRLSVNLSGKQKLALNGAGMMSLLVVLWTIIRVNQYQDFLYQGGLLLFSAAAACLVAVLAHPASFPGRIFALRPLRWLGECSYGIYLWHYPVIVLTSPTVNTDGLDAARALIQIAVSIALAALSRVWVEDPIRYGIRKPFTVKMKIPACILMIFLVLLATNHEGTQSLAIETSNDNIVQTESQVPVELAEPPCVVPPIEPVSGDQITAIGDSLMIGLEPFLQESFPGIVIDAKKSRQLRTAPEVISQLSQAGNLRKIVIIELGTNGPFTEEQLIETLNALAEAEKIILVNTRVPKPWETTVNDMLKKTAEVYPSVHEADWYAASYGHDEYFYQDGVHLNSVGAKAYCAMLMEALNAI